MLGPAGASACGPVGRAPDGGSGGLIRMDAFLELATSGF
jgi:hypothetical protein